MRYIYTLRIHAPEKSYSGISNVLGIIPNAIHGWAYEIVATRSNDITNFIELFLNILEGKELELQKYGASPDKIEFWMVYEYDGQCNMEFSPNDLYKMGSKGYTLCISCYESGA